MQRQNRKIIHEISKIEALLKFKRLQNAKRKKTKENAASVLEYNSDAVEDYKSLKEDISKAVFSFLRPRLTYHYAKVRITPES